jgi:hypothetical protein
MGEYLPSAPVSDEARRRNGNLPGQGGVFNLVNLHVYHYAGNNPVKYTDPDGEWVINNVAAGQNKTRDFILDISNSKKYLNQAANFVFDPDSNFSLPSIVTNGPFYPIRINLPDNLDSAIKMATRYANDESSLTNGYLTSLSAREIKKGVYEINISVTITNGVSRPDTRTGTIAFAGANEVLKNDGKTIDDDKVRRIAYEAINIVNNSPNKQINN